jgi:cytochrome c oxidase cbb3-type subunit I/II
MKALSSVGVPYKDTDIERSVSDARQQGEVITKDLAGEGVTVAPDTELVAVIAYLQRLGKKPEPPKSGPAVATSGDGKPVDHAETANEKPAEGGAK